MPLFRITLGLFCLLTAAEAAAQGSYRQRLEDSAFVASRRIKSIRVRHKNLRDYHSKHTNKRWQFWEEFEFTPSGRVQSYYSPHPEGKGSTQPFVERGRADKELDSLGRLRRETYRYQGRIVYDDWYEYDGRGRLQRVLRGLDASRPPKLYRTLYYDAAGRETGAVFYPSYFNSANGPGQLRKFYDAQGQLWATEFRTAPEQYPGFIDSLYYDAQGREIAQAHYMLPHNGFPMSLSWASRRAYQPDGQLAWTRHWTKDPKLAGKLQTWTYNAAGHLLSHVQQDYEKYYAAGQAQGRNIYEKRLVRYNDRGDFLEERQYYRHEDLAGTVLEEGLQEITQWQIKYYR